MIPLMLPFETASQWTSSGQTQCILRMLWVMSSGGFGSFTRVPLSTLVGHDIVLLHPLWRFEWIHSFEASQINREECLKDDICRVLFPPITWKVNTRLWTCREKYCHGSKWWRIIPTHLDAQDHLASYFLDLSINRMLAEAVCRGPEEPISIRISSDKHCNLQWHCQETVSWLHVAALNSIAEQWFCTPGCPVRSHQAQRRWIQSQFATDWKERCLHEEAVHLW